jgi:RHS repeat-associated protein
MSQARRSGSVTMNYRYNGRGEQVRRFLGSTNTYTLYDEAGHWLGDYDDNGAPLQQAIWLDDLPVGLLAADGQPYYIEPDHLGSPRVVIDPARDVAVWTWNLKGEAFGNTAPDQDPDGDGSAFVLDMRFPGQRYDASSGLNQNGFRDYEAATGRYPQSDPTGLSGGISTYGYAFGNPLLFIEPFGLAPNQACAAGWIATCTIVGGGIGYWGGGIIGGVAGSEVPIAGNAAGFVAGSQLGGMGGASAGGVLGGLTSSLVCPDEKPCPPCKTIDGQIVPAGTIGYRHDIVPPGKPHYPYKGSHYNLYKANQNPNNCKCFWQEVGASDAEGGLPPPPGSIPIRPFSN